MIFSSSGFCVDGILPDLVGVGGQVNLGIIVTIQDASFFVVKIEQRLVIVLVFEECFVRADDLSVLSAAAGAPGDAGG